MTSQIDAEIIADEIFTYIKDYIHQNDYPPTFAEIAEASEMSNGNVPRYLDRLEVQGRLTRIDRTVRSIRLL